MNLSPIPELKKHERLADRLVKILTMLNSGQKVSAKSLSADLKCSERTIIRDLERFEASIRLIQDGKHYSLDPKFVGKLSLTDIENFAQISGIQKLYPKLNTSFMRELLDARAGDVFAAKGYHHENMEQFLPLIEYFSVAIKQCHEVSFLYKGTPRTVQPYKIVHHQGSWYLAAVRDFELRAYRLSRVALFSDARPAVKFEPSTDILAQLESEENIWFGQDKMDVTLKVNAEVAMYFKQRNLLPEQKLLRQLDDGAVLLQSTVTHKTQILPLLRYWIPHIEVLAPERLKQQLKQSLSGYLETL